MIPKSLIAAVRRHYTCLRDSTEHCRPLGRPARYRAKKTEGLEPHPRAVLYYRPPAALSSGDWHVECNPWQSVRENPGSHHGHGIDDGLGLPRPKGI